MQSKTIKALGLFVLSYVLLYFAYVWLDFLPKWDGYGSTILHGQKLQGYLFVDPLFLFLPFVGFSLMWLALSGYSRHFKDDFLLSIPFALVFVVVSYLAYFVALIGYFWNNAYLVALAQGKSDAGFSSFGITFNFAVENFMDQLLKSPFFVFVLSALLGWVSFVIIHKYWGETLPHHSASHSSTTPST